MQKKNVSDLKEKMPPLKRLHLDKTREGSVFCKLSDLTTVLCEICNTVNAIGEFVESSMGMGMRSYLSEVLGRNSRQYGGGEQGSQWKRAWVWIWGSDITAVCSSVSMAREHSMLWKSHMSVVGSVLMPLSWLCCRVVHPWAVWGSGAVCAASSSEGANGWPVMSGVTRPQFQNTAVNKVKVSPFCWKEGLFLWAGRYMGEVIFQTNVMLIFMFFSLNWKEKGYPDEIHYQFHYKDYIFFCFFFFCF